MLVGEGHIREIETGELFDTTEAEEAVRRDLRAWEMRFEAAGSSELVVIEMPREPSDDTNVPALMHVLKAPEAGPVFVASEEEPGVVIFRGQQASWSMYTQDPTKTDVGVLYSKPVFKSSFPVMTSTERGTMMTNMPLVGWRLPYGGYVYDRNRNTDERYGTTITPDMLDHLPLDEAIEFLSFLMQASTGVVRGRPECSQATREHALVWCDRLYALILQRDNDLRELKQNGGIIPESLWDRRLMSDPEVASKIILKHDKRGIVNPLIAAESPQDGALVGWNACVGQPKANSFEELLSRERDDYRQKLGYMIAIARGI